MPNHADLPAAELHQDKLIASAVVLDAGKVTTPSSITPGVGVLRKLKVTELDGDSIAADTGKVWTPSGVTDDLPTLRFLSATEIDNLPVPVFAEFTDIGTAATEYSVLPHAAETVTIYVVLYAAITLVNETVTVTIGGATPIPVTVPFAGSGAGSITAATAALSAAQVAGVLVTVATAGNSTGVARAKVVVVPRS